MTPYAFSNMLQSTAEIINWLSNELIKQKYLELTGCSLSNVMVWCFSSTFSSLAIALGNGLYGIARDISQYFLRLYTLNTIITDYFFLAVLQFSEVYYSNIKNDKKKKKKKTFRPTYHVQSHRRLYSLSQHALGERQGTPLTFY